LRQLRPSVVGTIRNTDDFAGCPSVTHPGDFAVRRDKPSEAAFLNKRDGRGGHSAAVSTTNGEKVGVWGAETDTQKCSDKEIGDSTPCAESVGPRHGCQGSGQEAGWQKVSTANWPWSREGRVVVRATKFLEAGDLGIPLEEAASG